MSRCLPFLIIALAATISCKKPTPDPVVEAHIERLGKILGQDLIPSKTQFEFIKDESADTKLITSAQVDSIEMQVRGMGIGVRGIILGNESEKVFSYYGWMMEGDKVRLGINDINHDVRTPRNYYWAIK
ncbi:hypothetical protein DYBT9623_00662 [Dyadobacter sp. CECT 9623]|uniref:Uncharacterized protein n=1 Tax=Dyadobacter linearis TaxID=2823330 RepID=A0ABN7R754_9BACT|nr:hypothetical protein [Dyadobacter sp. CECT 9623]CAG5067934.1 hypothetical protein DYBT9623_00662 [Dyadobacter sp. CECT 9623]